MPWGSRILILGFLSLVAFASKAQIADGLHELSSDVDSIQARLDLIGDPRARTIDISTFELRCDRVGLTLIAALVDAAQRGAKIRLLVDRKIQEPPPGVVEVLLASGVEIRFHNPAGKFLEDAWKSPLGVFARANHRMHDKVFLVNGVQAIVGDKNYREKFFRFSLKDSASLTMVGKEIYLQGTATKEIGAYFEALWSAPDVAPLTLPVPSDRLRAQALERLRPSKEWIVSRAARTGEWRRPLHPYEDSEFLTDENEARTGHEQRTTLAKILDAIAEAPANSKILIENSYFVLFPELESALKKALSRGCEIVVVLNAPEATDQILIAAALRADLPKMIDWGLQVYLNTAARRITHAKSVTIGTDTVIVGSANFDPRSYRINSESSLRVVSPALAEKYWSEFRAHEQLRSRVVRAGSCRHVFADRTYEINDAVLSAPRNWLVDWVRRQL